MDNKQNRVIEPKILRQLCFCFITWNRRDESVSVNLDWNK